VEDFAVFADVECPAEGDGALGGDDSIFLCSVFFRIAENGIVEVELFGEFGVVFLAVTAGGEVGYVEFLDGVVRTERLALDCSAACEGFGEPGDNDGLLVFEVGEIVGLAVAAFEAEFGGAVAHFELVCVGCGDGHDADECGCQDGFKIHRGRTVRTGGTFVNA
jgi:hypothetical protein